MGGGKCDFWGVVESYECASDSRGTRCLYQWYPNVAETLRKAVGASHGRWWRTWGQATVRQVMCRIWKSPKSRSAEIYGIIWQIKNLDVSQGAGHIVWWKHHVRGFCIGYFLKNNFLIESAWKYLLGAHVMRAEGTIEEFRNKHSECKIIEESTA